MKFINNADVENWVFEFDKLPNVAFKTKSITLPSISLPASSISTPNRTMSLPSNRIMYDPFTLSYLLDSDLSNYLEIYSWLTSQAQIGPTMSNASVFFLDNEERQVAVMQMINAFPINLESPTLSVDNTGFEAIILSATFEHQGFEILA